MTNYFFVSDNHFGHEKILAHCQRPFASVEEMDEAMIRNWNRVVGRKDVVFHLGDFSFHTPQRTEDLRRRLHGSIRLIQGNHDYRRIGAIRHLFEWVKDLYEAEIPDTGHPLGVQRIILCHYAMRTWNKSHHGIWHLYGHSHHTLPEDPHSLSFDVGVDGWDFTPLSYAQVKEKMQAKTFIDPHKEAQG